jgi:hypothetical protein
VATIQSAKEKYARKTGPGSAAEAKYNAAKGRMAANWSAGLAAFGVNPGPIAQQSYQAGVAAARYRGGNPDKWEANFRAGISQ